MKHVNGQLTDAITVNGQLTDELLNSDLSNFSIPVMVRYGPYLSVNSMLWFINGQDAIRPVIPNETR